MFDLHVYCIKSQSLLLKTLQRMVDAAVSAASTMETSHTEVQLFEHDIYIVRYCYLAYMSADMSGSDLQFQALWKRSTFFLLCNMSVFLKSEVASKRSLIFLHTPLYGIILENKINEWIEMEGNRDKDQRGFERHHSTTEHLVKLMIIAEECSNN